MDGHKNAQDAENCSLKNPTSRSRRGDEAHSASESGMRSEPPHVGCYYFDLLNRVLIFETLVLFRGQSAALSASTVDA
jgi:hypothetical protein